MWRFSSVRRTDSLERVVGSKRHRKPACTRGQLARVSHHRPLLETLEDRALLTNFFTVMNTNSSGAGSLPAEVAAANANTDESIINFDPTVFATPQTITLTSTLTLDHSSEPKIPISIVGPAAGVTIAGGGASSDFSVITVTANTQQAAIKGDSPSAPITITQGNLAQSTESGAGIDDHGDLTLENVAINNNFSNGNGGGVEVIGAPDIFGGNPGAALLASDTTFSNNVAEGAGGGVDMEGTAALIVNCTFSGNSANTHGGAINNGPLAGPSSIVPVNLGVINTTISGNDAADGGGINNNNGGTFGGGIMGLLNTIVTGNTTSALDPDLDGGSVLLGSGHDQIGDANGLAGTGIVGGINGNFVGAPSFLAPFGDYGGADDTGALVAGGEPNQTFALLPGSPAIGDAFILATLTDNVGINDTMIQAGTPLPLPTLNGSTFPYQQGKVIMIGSEKMLVTGVSGSAQNGYTLTVTRGVDGTIPASHVVGNEIDLPDERGVFSASDSIGAYQTQGFVVTANSGGSPQSTTISTAFANPLGVTVTANDPGAPVDNGVITFTAPASGASTSLGGNPATISGGTASVNATANGTAGSYAVSASAGFGTSATFNLTNTGTGGTTLPTSNVASLPATETATSFTVSWSGSDPGGPGIASFDVFVSDNGGPFTVFQSATTATSATFTGVNGHTYGFYSVATSTDGNQQTIPAAAQATTKVVAEPNALYVVAVYEDVLGRLPDAGGMSFWTLALNSGTPVSSVAEAIAHSDEYYQTFVIRPAYSNLLGRTADAGGVTFWTVKMDGGVTDQELEADLVSSPEFYANAGGTNTLWIDAVYKLLLGRAPDANGETFWNGRLAAGQTLNQVAQGIAGSQENNTQLINEDYFHYLGRAADSGGLDFWLSQFAAGKTNEDVIAGFTGSPEYYTEHTS